MTTKQLLLNFLQQQKFLVLSTVDEDSKPWITNLYYSINSDFEIFFMSPTNTKHSRHIKTNANVAFSTLWFDENDLSNRKGIQGTGICTRISDPAKISRYLRNHHQYFPAWKKIISLRNILQKVIESRPYIIKPDYIKFWDDELYGDEGTEEFNF